LILRCLKALQFYWRFLDSSFLENSAAGLLDNEVLALYESQELRKILFLYQFIFFDGVVSAILYAFWSSV
jgi:hypothetical protein